MRKILIVGLFFALGSLVAGCEEDRPVPGGQDGQPSLSDSQFFARVARLGATEDPLTPQQISVVSGGGGGETFYKDCDASACWCVGSSDCLDMITSNDCEFLRCNSSPQGPVCWCDLELVSGTPGSLQGN